MAEVADKRDTTTMVTASSLAKLAILDTYGHYIDEEPRFLNWVIRGIKKLISQTLRSPKRYTTLNVNRNTRTAILPCDFKEELSVFVINSCGERIDLDINSKIVNTEAIEDSVPCENECDHAHDCDCLPKQLCTDLSTTQTIVKIRINDTDYDQTITSTLQPNGEYYVVTTTPYLDMKSNEGVIYKTTTEYVTTFEVADCGCIKDTPRNNCRLEAVCPDLWACYCCNTCGGSDSDFGGYRIFAETGIIKFDKGFAFDKAYMAYRGFLPRQGNEYLIPEIASETVVNYAKFKAVENKKGVALNDKMWHWDRYEVEYTNLRIITTRISISDIIRAALAIPKFDHREMACAPCATIPAASTGTVTPVTASVSEVLAPTTSNPDPGCNPAVITTNGQEMENGQDYHNATLAGVPIRIFSNIVNRFLKEGDEYDLFTTGGFHMKTGTYGLWDEFDIFPKWCDANTSDIPDTVVMGMRKMSIKVDGVAGSPVAGSFTFQHNNLIGADVQEIRINKQVETVIDGDFTFDSTTGTITRTQVWQTDDTGIIDYSK